MEQRAAQPPARRPFPKVRQLSAMRAASGRISAHVARGLERLPIQDVSRPGPGTEPSPTRLAKGLERAAHEAERYASKLRELGLGDAARGVASAARELAGAADKTLKLASN